MHDFLASICHPDEAASFNFDVKNIKWDDYSMNLAYGLKYYILKEDAAVPSLGYNDVVNQLMKNTLVSAVMPWGKRGQPVKMRPREEMKALILSKESVKQAIAALVKEKIEYYRGTLFLDADEDKIYREVVKTAQDSMDTIFSNYNHKMLVVFGQIIRKIFTTIYDKIVVNERALKNLRTLCADRKGPVIFVPTHRSYVDFLMVSAVLYAYQMEVPHICAGEDLMMITGVSHILRMSGAFFMRRTFRGDPLYKAIFTEYVT